MKKLVLALMLPLFLVACNPPLTEEEKQLMYGGLTIPPSIEPTVTGTDSIPGDTTVAHKRVAYSYKITQEVVDDILKQKIFWTLPLDNVFVDKMIYEFMDVTDKGHYIIIPLNEKDVRDQRIILVNTTRMELTIITATI